MDIRAGEHRLNLKAQRRGEIEKYLKEIGEKPYRATQIIRWLWQKGESDIMKFSDLPLSLRKKLAEDFFVHSVESVSIKKSSSDGSIKFLLRLFDSKEVESVFIPDGKRRTVCVSSQVGCPLKCAFCATGMLGYKRNLEFWEILEQVRFVRDYVGERITNVVFMGMGEPMLNLDNVFSAIDLLQENDAFKIGARKITVSTAGIVPGIYRLLEYGKQVKLAVSLNSAIQEKREKIMPIARRYPLSELKKAILDYYRIKRRWVTFEYIQLPEVNDSEEDVRALERFIKGIPCKINLIPYNSFEGSLFREPTEREIERFLRKLYRLKATITLRKSKGKDIKGACGQLAYLK